MATNKAWVQKAQKEREWDWKESHSTEVLTMNSPKAARKPHGVKVMCACCGLECKLIDDHLSWALVENQENDVHPKGKWIVPLHDDNVQAHKLVFIRILDEKNPLAEKAARGWVIVPVAFEGSV